MPENQDLLPSADLTALVDDPRVIISQGRERAATVVNAEMVRTYWRMGECIVREEQGATRSAYGEGSLARLGVILSREFGRGFAERSLQNMRQFYLAYPNASALRAELVWSHYRTLMRLPDNQRAFYERVAAGGRWSSRELEKQIGEEDFYIDLVFLHRTLRCQIFIDLKIGALTHADISQMQLYLAWARKYDMQEGENDPIGLILCGSRNEQEVELLLADSNRPQQEHIKIARYLLLNNEAAIKQRLAEISAAYEAAHHQVEPEG